MNRPSSEQFRLILDSAATLAMATASIAVVWSVFAPRVPAKPMNGGPNNRWERVVGLETTAGPHSVNHGRARIAVIEFSDFQCPFCARYAANVFPALKKEFIDSEQIEYVFRNFPLESIHGEALRDAQTFVCAAGEGKMLEIRDLLFHSDRKVPAAGRTAQFVARLQMDPLQFSRCMSGHSAEIVERDQAEGRRLGVSSTPTFLVGEVDGDRITVKGRMEGAPPLEEFRKAIADALNRSTRR